MAGCGWRCGLSPEDAGLIAATLDNVTSPPPAFEFHTMALAAIKADSLKMFEPIERPGMAGRAVLYVGEDDERPLIVLKVKSSPQ